MPVLPLIAVIGWVIGLPILIVVVLLVLLIKAL